jgi:hypothetical protein
MQTVSHSEGLVVWTEPKALDEAKSLFAPYAPRFETVPCHVKSGLGKPQVSVLYLSRTKEDSAVERTLATPSGLQGIDAPGLYATPFGRFCLPPGNYGRPAEVRRG